MNPSHSPLISTRNAPGRTGDPNLHGVERLVSGLLGGWLVARGLRKGGVLGLLELAAGGMAIARGGSGQCNAKRALSPTPYESQLADEHHWGRARALSKSITVNRPRDEVYRYWRDFSNMPTFMEFIERVETRDDHPARAQRQQLGCRSMDGCDVRQRSLDEDLRLLHVGRRHQRQRE